MHKINQLARLAVSATALILSVAAEPTRPMVEATQSFTIHGQTYEAGTYRVREVTPAGVMMLRHEQTGRTMILMTDRTGSPNDQTGARMVFALRKGRLELTEVWTGSGSGHVIR